MPVAVIGGAQRLFHATIRGCSCHAAHAVARYFRYLGIHWLWIPAASLYLAWTMRLAKMRFASTNKGEGHMNRKAKKDETKKTTLNRLVLKKLTVRDLANVTGGAPPACCTATHHC
jgi:hypothetical protein